MGVTVTQGEVRQLHTRTRERRGLGNAKTSSDTPASEVSKRGRRASSLSIWRAAAPLPCSESEQKP